MAHLGDLIVRWREDPGAAYRTWFLREERLKNFRAIRRGILQGFLPLQCAYADFYAIDALWPEMQPGALREALEWYAAQDVTLGG